MVSLALLRKALGKWTSRPLPSEEYLRRLMQRYQVKDLVNIDSDSFRREIDTYLQTHNYEMEGLKDPSLQRDLSIDFHWGHDHDFGPFALKGQMGARHITHLAEYIDRFGAIPRRLDGLRVLDIGCWTGGTSLLLCAMGAHVVALDEVKKYVDCLAYLKHAFALDTLEVRHQSLYACTDAAFRDTQDVQDAFNAFDIVLFAGVLYHVTDPILALRITFNCLKDGGLCLLETTGFRASKPLISYGRRRWNWFDLSPPALRQMLQDVGYRDIQIGPITHHNRLYAVARRATHVDMRRDGLSRRDVR